MTVKKLDNKNLAEDIKPKDDAFHGSKRLAAEWWYFDAVFSNNYSVHIGFRTFSRKKLGTVMPFLEIYKNGKLEFEEKKRFRFKNLKTSKKIPFVKIFNSFLMEFDEEKYKKDGEWIYKVAIKMGDNAVNLTFKGLTKGWKIQTDKESWTVGLPKADVFGEIILNGKKISVDGIGYHDHNWNYTFLTALTYGKGWYWGKIRSKNYNIVWANIVKRDGEWELLAVVNKDGGDFYNVNAKKIIFKPEKFIKFHKKKTPSKFMLKFSDVVEGKKIDAEVKMDVADFHFSSVLLAPYWRYHVKSLGHISIDEKKEKIDSMDIMEYLSFS